MNNLKDAINSKVLDTSIYNDVQGRFYYKSANSPDYPRIVYSRVSGVPDNAFAKNGESVLLQFDLYSMASAGNTEIETMETDLKALLDDCQLTITGKTLVWFERTNIMGPMEEDVSALNDGTVMVSHTAIDYNVTYQNT